MVFDSQFWNSTENTILENPLQPGSQRLELLHKLNENNLKSQILIRTSGTTLKSAFHEKWISLSRASFLNSARAVNEYFNFTSLDDWLSVLPTFHVGGLAQHARAFLVGSRVVSIDRWNAEEFVEAATKHSSRVSSLVPTQIYDLVTKGLSNPGFHTIFVGGGVLEQSLATRAVELGWPIVATYGMTETCSQIATQNLTKGETSFTTLPHAEIRLTSTGLLEINCQSLFTGQFFFDGHEWSYTPAAKDWFTTEDIAEFSRHGFRVLGRGQDVVKVLGENVSLLQLESKLSQFLMRPLHQLGVCAVPDARRGSQLILVVEGDTPSIMDALQRFNAESVGFERIFGVLCVEAFPRTALGKMVRSQLTEQVKQNAEKISWLNQVGSSR